MAIPSTPRVVSKVPSGLYRNRANPPGREAPPVQPVGSLVGGSASVVPIAETGPHNEHHACISLWTVAGVGRPTPGPIAVARQAAAPHEGARRRLPWAR